MHRQLPGSWKAVLLLSFLYPPLPSLHNGRRGCSMAVVGKEKLTYTPRAHTKNRTGSRFGFLISLWWFMANHEPQTMNHDGPNGKQTSLWFGPISCPPVIWPACQCQYHHWCNHCCHCCHHCLHHHLGLSGWPGEAMAGWRKQLEDLGCSLCSCARQPADHPDHLGGRCLLRGSGSASLSGLLLPRMALGGQDTLVAAVEAAAGRPR